MKVPTRGFQFSQPGGQIDQSLGDQMDDLSLDLQLPINTKEAGPQQFPTLPLDQLRVNDDIGQAAFIFQCNEDDSGRGSWPLSADDDAGSADQGAMARALEFGCRKEAMLGQVTAQQGQRMGAQRQAEMPVIGDEIFACTRGRQSDIRLDQGEAIEEIALHHCRRSRPGRLPAMAGKLV